MNYALNELATVLRCIHTESKVYAYEDLVRIQLADLV